MVRRKLLDVYVTMVERLAQDFRAREGIPILLTLLNNRKEEVKIESLHVLGSLAEDGTYHHS